MKVWRGALVGCGFFAANQMNAWRAIPNATIVALCDRDVERARRMGLEFGVTAIYEDAGTMLEQVPVDFVDIATTVAAHRGLVELSALHASLVICQKPFAATLHDADAMIDACTRAKATLLIHENFRWQKPFIEIERCLRRGAIGRPRVARLTFRHAFDIYANQPYLREVERLAIMDVGLHLFDVARFLFGDVASVRCSTERLNPKVRGEDVFLASLGHCSGAETIVDCSFFSHEGSDLFPQTLVHIEGTNGSLWLGPDYRLRLDVEGSSSELIVEPQVPAWGAKPWHVVQDSVLNLQHHAIDVVEGRAMPHPSGAHNRGTLAIALAAYESAATGRAVTLDVDPDNGL